MTLFAPTLSYVLPTIFAATQQAKSWQTRVAAMNCVEKCVSVAPEMLHSCLPDIVPELTPCMTDTKKEVKKAAKDTM